MDTMKYQIKQDKKYEVYAVYKSCGLLSQGFYSKVGLIPTNKPFEGNLRTIYLPNLEYSKKPDYWDKVKKYKPKSLPPKDDLYEFISKILPSENTESTNKKVVLQVLLEKHGKLLSKSLKNLNVTLPKAINVCPVRYGSLCSFICKSSENPIPTILIRLDTPISHIFEGIISAILAEELDRKYKWDQRESIIDHLTSTFIKGTELEKEYSETISIINSYQIDKKVIKNSQEFLAENKIHYTKQFTIKNDDILIHGNKTSQIFTPEEQRILKSLIRKSNNTLSYEEISDIVYDEDSSEKFSLWALNKRMQRLRDKIEDEGLKKSTILAVRNIGYHLVN